MSLVSSTKTESYAIEAVRNAISVHFARLGADTLLHEGAKVAIKPNLLAARDKDACVTTHPAITQAVVEYCRAKGVKDIVIAESPSGPFNKISFEKICRVAGYGDFDCVSRDYSTVEKNGFSVLKPIADADIVINLPKLKTHGLTRMTAGIKNLFGCIPGLMKPEMHAKYPDVDSFSGMLLALEQTVKPQITLLDAIDCMEGNGPGGGTKRHMGYILASRDVFALDHSAATLMGYDPMDVVMLKMAKERGLYVPDEITLEGDPLQPARPPFTEPDSIAGTGITALRFLAKHMKIMPRVIQNRCVGCGKCAESCPMHLIRIENRKAVMTKKGCISCFCCQEMCPQKAIKTHRILR